jgi:hypothetical protein
VTSCSSMHPETSTQCSAVGPHHIHHAITQHSSMFWVNNWEMPKQELMSASQAEAVGDLILGVIRG